MIIMGVRVSFGGVKLVGNGIVISIGMKQTWEKMLSVSFVNVSELRINNEYEWSISIRIRTRILNGYCMASTRQMDSGTNTTN
jgi:hypothetical protein